MDINIWINTCIHCSMCVCVCVYCPCFYSSELRLWERRGVRFAVNCATGERNTRMQKCGCSSYLAVLCVCTSTMHFIFYIHHYLKDIFFSLVLTRPCGCCPSAGSWPGPASHQETRPEPDSHCSTDQLWKCRGWEIKLCISSVNKSNYTKPRITYVALCVCVCFSPNGILLWSK